MALALGQVHFHLDLQTAFIVGHGTQCLVSPVLQCPCLTAERQFSPICPTCHGTGRYYPAGAQYSTMLLTQQETSKRTFLDAGSWTAGSIMASVLPGVRLCERDKVRMVDITDSFVDETLVRGMDDAVRFRYGVELLVAADLTTVYTPGVDYVLAPPGTVSWLPGGRSPAFMTQYAVRYNAQPEFLVVNDSPRLRLEHRIPQAQEVVLMRLDKLSEDF